MNKVDNLIEALSLYDEISNPKGTPLIFDEYKKYQIPSRFEKGQWVFKFENNYGASVIKRYGSYGYDEDLFELAVLKFNSEQQWTLCYDTKITSDVLGHLTNDDVLEILKQIKDL